MNASIWKGPSHIKPVLSSIKRTKQKDTKKQIKEY